MICFNRVSRNFYFSYFSVLIFLPFIFILNFPKKIYAETGMCLVVCASEFEASGEIRRIDLKDDVVINTTGKIASGNCPRFAPDGNSFAYLLGSTVILANLDGTEIRRFDVDGQWSISYTNKGIYVSNSVGKFSLYNTSGQKIWEKTFPDCKAGARVSQNGALGGGTNDFGMVIYYMEEGSSNPIGDESGCSVWPSPNGTMLTKNKPGHITMDIRNANGNILQTIHIQDIIGHDPRVGYWGFNSQTWSGNSNDVIVVPVGQDDHWPEGSSVQLTQNCSPYIYNLATRKAYRLASRTTDFWEPYDYYQGKTPGTENPDFSLSSSSLSFTAQAGGSNPAAKTLIVTATGGLSLSPMTVSDNANWLTVSPSVTGDTRTIFNGINISGLSSGTSMASVTVTVGTIKKTYQVMLTLSKPGIRGFQERNPPALDLRACVPNSNRLAFMAAIPEKGPFTLHAFDPMGRKVFQYGGTESATRGIHYVNASSSKFDDANGIYTVVLRQNGKQIVRIFSLAR